MKGRRKRSDEFTGVFPRSSEEMITDLWDSFRPEMLCEGLQPTETPPSEVKYVLKMVDVLVQKRIYEVLSRVGLERTRNNQRARDRVANRVRSIKGTFGPAQPGASQQGQLQVDEVPRSADALEQEVHDGLLDNSHARKEA